MCSVEQKPMFRDLTADDPDPEVTEIESLCMNCHANGKTRLLLTRIPFYKNVVIMSFSCEECGYENNEVQPGGAYAELGVKWKLRVETAADLNRQVVKSDYTSVRIPELEFEIPAQSQKGEVTTVEGIIERAAAGLALGQGARRAAQAAAADQIERFVRRLRDLQDLELGGAFSVEFEDISGNCFVENPMAPRKDSRCERTDFKRSKEQDHALGIYTHEEMSRAPAEESLLAAAPAPARTYEALAADEVVTFRTNCAECNAPADTNMKLTDIPHFKEVVIMATVCDACGARTNEVRAGGGVAPRGLRARLAVRAPEDFSRDVLKSETCGMSIPELELEVGGRALGGRFTTAEGLLRATAAQLAAAAAGDAPGPAQPALHSVVEQLEEVLDGKRSITIVLDDPAGNSYVQSLADDPTVADEGLTITHYERTFEQNDELGLNDMKTEGYEEDKS